MIPIKQFFFDFGGVLVDLDFNGTIEAFCKLGATVPETFNSKSFHKIFRDFEDLGYSMAVKVLYAPDYGVPQIRRRAFFVGLRNTKETFIFPEPTT